MENKLLLYHGSDFNFKDFEFKNVGKKSGTHGSGFGIYLSSSPLDAMIYGHKLYTVFATLKRGLSNELRTLTIPQLHQMTEYFNQLMPSVSISEYDFAQELNDRNIIDKMMMLFPTETVLKVLKKMGITHMLDTITPVANGYKDVLNYCIYDLDCLTILEKREGDEIFEFTDTEKVFGHYMVGLNESRMDIPQLDDLFEMQEFDDDVSFMLNYQSDFYDELNQEEGRARSKSQRRLMAMALAYKRGKLDPKYASDSIKKLAGSIKQQTLEEFARTKQKKRRKDGSIGKRNAIPHYVKDKKK